MNQTRFYTVDAFTQRRFNGAPVAVFTDAGSISETMRQQIAAEMNLSQSVFLAPYKDGFTLSAYSPTAATGFGGHTAIAAACALEADQQVSLSAQQAVINFYQKDIAYAATLNRPAGAGIGLPFVSMSVNTDPIVDTYAPSVQELAGMLSLDPSDILESPYSCKLVSNMGLYLVVPIKNIDAVRRAKFNHHFWQQSCAPGTLAQQILLMTESTDDFTADFHLRLMGAQISEQEDPPVGSSIPAFAAFLCAHQHLALGTYCYTIERGLRRGRHSLLQVEMDHRGHDMLALRIGGNGLIMTQGDMYISHLKAVN